MSSCSSPPRPVSAPDFALATDEKALSAHVSIAASSSSGGSSSHPVAGRLPSLLSPLLPSFARDRRLPPPIPTSATVTDPREYTSTTLRGGWPQPGVANHGGLRSVGSAPSAPSFARSASLRMLKPSASTPEMHGAAGVPSLPTRRISSPSSAFSTSSSVEVARPPFPHLRAGIDPHPWIIGVPEHGKALKPTASHQLPAAEPPDRVGRNETPSGSPRIHPPAINSVGAVRMPHDYSVLRNDSQTVSLHPAHQVFPADDPRIPPLGHAEGQRVTAATQSAKRTIFTPYELSLLQALWGTGAYYPAHWQVEEVQNRTGLSRVQIRNW